MIFGENLGKGFSCDTQQRRHLFPVYLALMLLCRQGLTVVSGIAYKGMQAWEPVKNSFLDRKVYFLLPTILWPESISMKTLCDDQTQMSWTFPTLQSQLKQR